MPDTSGVILSIDHGTTGNRVFLYDTRGTVITHTYREYTQHYPAPGLVEHDGEELMADLELLIQEALAKGNIRANKILGIGITNQRETSIVWEKDTGKPIHRAIVWQCRRTAPRCQELKQQGYEPGIREKTGLVIDAYFSATKFEWILNHVNGAKDRASRGELLCGTMDSFLLYRLTGEFKTDYTNASRTMLFNIKEKKWDRELLDLFQIPEHCLAEVQPSASHFGTTKGLRSLPDGIPVLAMAGDQQAALFGQLCIHPGEAKNTYGTGAFLLFQLGDQHVLSKSGLITTLACDEKGKPTYALEGSIFIAGAVIQWLRDYMRFFAEASETQEIAESLPDETDDVMMVPAFAGLGAPHWDMSARGAIFGITRDTTPARIVRASLKSIALQSLDLVHAMERDTGQVLESLRVDGGASANDYLLQYQADIIGKQVIRPKNVDTTASGVAYLAGIQAGVWEDAKDLDRIEQTPDLFRPSMKEELRRREIDRWNRALERVKGWAG